ncbi:hypothetical protein [Kitasatospora sp. NPDC059803]|uniref:hypothetical protein n=1 Tax=Kitasatospora sp. NPDC059803 TaxID=3346953 RepID=UPI003649F5FA
MTITTSAPPSRSTPVALARGFLTGAVIGGSLAALVVGVVVEKVPLFIGGLGLPIVYGLLLLLAGAPRRAREAEVVPRTALAVIESLRAIGGETSDVPVRFDLTVVPDDEPAYRVGITQDINLVDLPDYRPRGVLVVKYPPDRPWRVTIVKRPTPEWEERAAGAQLDSAPESPMVTEPSEGRSTGFVRLFGLLLAAAAVVFLFRVDLFEQQDSAASPAPTVTSTWSTTVVSSGTGTVSLGPDQSFLDDGELRKAINSLTEGKDPRQAITVFAQDRVLSVVFSPSGTKAPQFDPLSLPYERFPALVKEAETTLGVHSPTSWQITADHLAGSLTIRVGVTGPEGSASLEANGEGQVVRRAPAR